MIDSDQSPPSAAEARAAAARARLADTISKLQSRLSPKALARDAAFNLIERARDATETGVAAVRRHPMTLLATVSALGLFVARRPIVRTLMRWRNATSPAPTSLKPDGARAAPKG